MRGAAEETTGSTSKGNGKQVEVTPAEERDESPVSSRESSKANSPRDGDANGVENNGSKLDSNLIVKTSENGKIEDIISPVVLSQKKPYQEESASSSKTDGEDKQTDNVDSSHLTKDQVKSNTTATTSTDPITSKLSQTSLKRRKVPPPLGITPTTKKSQHSNTTTNTTNNSNNSTCQQTKKVSKPQILQRPRVQYLGKIHQSRHYSQTATTPYFHNRMRYGPPPTVVPPQPQPHQQVPPPGFAPSFPTNGVVPPGIPSLPMGPIPLPQPFPTSTTPYMAPSYYYPYTRMPPNTAMIPQTATTAAAAHYPYANPINTMPDYLYRNDSVPSDGSDFSIKRQMSKSPMSQDNKEDNTEEQEQEDDEEIEGSDLAIGEGAVPTPIFTRFPQGISSDQMSNGNATTTPNNGIMFGEIRIQDNRYSFEFPQRDDKEFNKKIFMSICNQIWNECDK